MKRFSILLILSLFVITIWSQITSLDDINFTREQDIVTPESKVLFDYNGYWYMMPTTTLKTGDNSYEYVAKDIPFYAINPFTAITIIEGKIQEVTFTEGIFTIKEFVEISEYPRIKGWYFELDSVMIQYSKNTNKEELIKNLQKETKKITDTYSELPKFAETKEKYEKMLTDSTLFQHKLNSFQMQVDSLITYTQSLSNRELKKQSSLLGPQINALRDSVSVYEEKINYKNGYNIAKERQRLRKFICTIEQNYIVNYYPEDKWKDALFHGFNPFIPYGGNCTFARIEDIIGNVYFVRMNTLQSAWTPKAFFEYVQDNFANKQVYLSKLGYGEIEKLADMDKLSKDEYLCKGIVLADAAKYKDNIIGNKVKSGNVLCVLLEKDGYNKLYALPSFKVEPKLKTSNWVQSFCKGNFVNVIDESGNEFNQWMWRKDFYDDLLLGLTQKNAEELEAARIAQEKLEQEAAAKKATMLKQLTSKYGASLARRLVNGEIWIGMTKDMFLDSNCWPSYPTKSYQDARGTVECWENYFNVITFVNDKVYSIQTRMHY